MYLSIIIPTYNCKGKIEKCLDSIYSQGIDMDDFEIICVDDCSPDKNSVEAIKSYKYNTTPPLNLRLINHAVNKRQGGARNTGVEHASGEYIHFIDQDDIFLPGKLLESLQCVLAQKQPLDMAMHDFAFLKDRCHTDRQYPHNNDKILDGNSFLKENELTWAPWGYFYRRDFLLRNNLRFVEHVQFEDVDFVIKCILKATRIQFIPMSIILYTVHENSQTNIGRDTIDKVDFFFNLSRRVKNIPGEENVTDPAVRHIIRSHANFAYKIATYRLIYLHKFGEKKKITYKYLKQTFNADDGRYLSFISEYPVTFVVLIHIASPILRSLVRLKKAISVRKGEKNSQL